MKKIFFTSVVFLLCIVEAHDFKVGDTWFFSVPNGVTESNIISVDKKGVIFLAKEKNQTFAINISYLSDETIKLYFPGEKEIKMKLLNDGSYIPKKRKSKSVVLSKNKVLLLNELFINKNLTLKENSVMFFPLPKYWKPKYMKDKTNLLKLNISSCDKLKGICSGELSTKDYYINMDIYLSDSELKNKVSRAPEVSLNVDDEKYNKLYGYTARYYPAITRKFVKKLNLPSEFSGKIFSFNSGKSGMPMEIYFDIDEKILKKLINKQKSKNQNNNPPYFIKGTNCVDHNDGRNGEWISEMYRRGGVLDTKGCLIGKYGVGYSSKHKIVNTSIQKNRKTKTYVPVMIGGEPDEDACGGVGEIRGVSRHGDGYIAVRSGPGTKYKIIDKIYRNGTGVAMCDSHGKWEGVVYGKGNCGTGSPVNKRQPYRGECKSGWVFEKYVRLVAG